MTNWWDRPARQWWYIGDGTVEEVVGHEVTTTPGFWWCPAVGVSARVGTELFETREEAVLRLVEKLRIERQRIDKALVELVTT